MYVLVRSCQYYASRAYGWLCYVIILPCVTFVNITEFYGRGKVFAVIVLYMGYRLLLFTCVRLQEDLSYEVLYHTYVISN
jgi:hypothetical protein